MLIVAGRTELDEQIEKVFTGVEEGIYRSKCGIDLVTTLNHTNQRLVCSLVHKLGQQSDSEDEAAADAFIEELKKSIPKDFKGSGIALSHFSLRF